jgi:hypothetical protein
MTIFLASFARRLAAGLRSLSAWTMIGCIAATPALAVPQKVKRECRDDYKTFCPSYKIGTAKMRSCMRANGRQLSWGCYESLRDAGYVKGRR